MESDLHPISAVNLLLKYADDTNLLVPENTDVEVADEYLTVSCTHLLSTFKRRDNPLENKWGSFQALNLQSRTLWLTISNAFEKSMRRHRTYALFSHLFSSGLLLQLNHNKGT